MNFGPVVPSVGPPNARIFILGDHPHETTLFNGEYELRRMLTTIGVNLHDCYRSTVFSRQPAGGAVQLFGLPNAPPETRSLGPLTRNPITYLDPDWLPELDRLRAELLSVSPNVVIALGPVACWALLQQSSLTELRGTIHVSNFLPTRELKVLPTYHPSAVLRQWDTRVIALADLEKAHSESHSPKFQYDNTELWLQPTLADLYDFGDNHLHPATICATDVETKRGQITCVSFAPNPQISLTVPFWQDGSEPNYWPTDADEAEAWKWVAHWIEKPGLVKVLQNGTFDFQYFARHGMVPQNFREDTMLAHHSLYSEMRKGLGFLGSIYANVPSWKFMRTYKVEEQLKRDD